MRTGENEKIPIAIAVELLKKDGIKVTNEQAKIIRDFLYDIAEIIVLQLLSGQEFCVNSQQDCEPK